MKKIVPKIVAVGLLIVVIALPILFIIAIYSGGLLYFGITYEKMSDFILFIIISIGLAGILEFFSNTLVQVSFQLKRINKKQSTFFKFVFDFCTSIFSLLIVDHYMRSVNVPFRTMLLFSLFMTGISYFISNGKEETDINEIDSTLSNEIRDLLSKNNIVDTIHLFKEEHPDLSMNWVRKAIRQISQKDDV